MLQIKTQTKYGVLRILRRKRFNDFQVDSGGAGVVPGSNA